MPGGEASMTTSEHVHPISAAELEHIRHPSESAAKTVVRWVAAPLAVIAVGSLILVIPLLIAARNWLRYRRLGASLSGSSVLVGPNSLPVVHESVTRVSRRLGLPGPPNAYVVSGGASIGAMYRAFARRFVILPSDLVSNASPAEIDFAVASFLGVQATGRERFGERWEVIDRLANIWLIRLAIMPYMRASTFTGDRLALTVCGDLEAALRVFDRLLVGESLAPMVSTAAMTRQASDLARSLSARLETVFSPQPMLVARRQQVLDFAAQEGLSR